MRRILGGLTGIGVLAAAALGVTMATAKADSSGQGGAVANASDVKTTRGQHYINLDWKFPADLNEYKYSIRVDTPIDAENVYYAHFLGAGDAGGWYMGLQPHPNGQAGVRFSYFGSGATPIGDTCRSGADEQSGVTCGLDDIDYKQGGTYTFDAKKISDDGGATWEGTVTDEASGETRKIGTWKLPASVQLDGDGDAFVEKYGDLANCGEIPDVDVTYSNGTANGTPVKYTTETVKATNTPTESDPCRSFVSYVATATPGGYTLRSHTGTTVPDAPAPAASDAPPAAPAADGSGGQPGADGSGSGGGDSGMPSADPASAGGDSGSDGSGSPAADRAAVSAADPGSDGSSGDNGAAGAASDCPPKADGSSAGADPSTDPSVMSSPDPAATDPAAADPAVADPAAADPAAADPAAADPAAADPAAADPSADPAAADPAAADPSADPAAADPAAADPAAADGPAGVPAAGAAGTTAMPTVSDAQLRAIVARFIADLNAAWFPGSDATMAGVSGGMGQMSAADWTSTSGS